MNKAFWFVLVMTAAGCQVSNKMHPWQSPGDPFSVQVDTTQWTPIQSQCVGRVAPEYTDEACELLAQAEAVEIPLDKAREMCPNAQFDPNEQLRPFLLRSVAYTGPCIVGLARIDEETGWVFVFQATSNLEMYIPGVRYVTTATPIVVLLRDRPKRVFCVAYVGGDRVLTVRHMNAEQTW